MQSTNQFKQSAEKGLMDLRFNPSVIGAQVDSSGVGSLVPGQAVKLVDNAGGVPKVLGCGADTDDVFGFVNYSIKDQSFVANDALELAVFRDNVMYMEANAAIARGAKLMIVVAGQKVDTATSGKTVIGRALDKATAAGQFIRVQIDLPGTALP